MESAIRKHAPLSLSQFLMHLAVKHLDQLAKQCKVKLGNVEKDKSTVVRGIMQYAAEHPKEPLRIVNNEKAKPFKFSLPKKEVTVIRLGNDLWKPRVRTTKQGKHVEWELKNPPEHQIEGLIVVGARLSDGFFRVLFGPVVELLDIAASKIVVADCSHIRIHKLVMDIGSRLFVTGSATGAVWLPRAAHVEVDTYQGPWMAAPGDRARPCERRAPAISSSVRRTWAANPDLLTRRADHVYTYDGLPATLSLRGEDAPSHNRRPAPETGAKGSIGSCDVGAEYVPPGDGESFAGRIGLAGAPGESGGDGGTPCDLYVGMRRMIHVETENRYTCERPGAVIRISAVGGWGGKGGHGDSGQNITAGEGGDLSRWCSLGGSDRVPGSGGDAGIGGDAGPGGTGGRGGDGGSIQLDMPTDCTTPDGAPIPVEELYLAVTRRGNGGKGGMCGKPGWGGPGTGGRWLDWLDDTPSSPAGPMGSGGSWGWPGRPLSDKVQAADGRSGSHGCIWIGGALKVVGGIDDNEDIRYYSWPPQTLSVFGEGTVFYDWEHGDWIQGV